MNLFQYLEKKKNVSESNLKKWYEALTGIHVDDVTEINEEKLKKTSTSYCENICEQDVSSVSPFQAIADDIEPMDL